MNNLIASLSAVILSILILGTGCSPGNEGKGKGDTGAGPLFRMVPPEESGLQFFNEVVETNVVNIINNIYYYNGSGVAVGDINNDGLPDIYMASMLGHNQLFLNLGGLKFRNISMEAGIQGRQGITTGVNMADVNADGLLDIYVCKSGFRDPRLTTNELLINRGNLRFSEEAAAYGLADPSYSNQSYFFDYDLDGDLDMYLVNHPLDFSEKNRILKPGQEIPDLGYQASDKLYENTGDGRFTDVTREAGVYGMNFGLSASITDMNGDGWPDVFVANDFLNPDNVWINNGDGTFTDRCKEYLRHVSFSSMGSDYADINNDGYNDLFVLDMAWRDPERSKRNMMFMSPDNFKRIIEGGYHYTYPESMMHLNLGNNAYTEIGQMLDMGKTGWSWTPLLIDLDNDGWKDLFISNGILRDIVDKDFEIRVNAYAKATREPRYYDDLILPHMPASDDHNFIYRNRGGGLSFEDVSVAWGMGDPTNDNGAAYADLDGDGDLDLVTNNLHEPSAIYENLASDRLEHNYLQVRLKGSGSNPFAVGSSVTIEHGSSMQRHELNPARGFLSSSDYLIHFGLADSLKPELLRVTWPDGKVSEIREPGINRLLEISHETALQADAASGSRPDPLFEDITDVSGIDFLHKEQAFDDFEQERLLPHKFSENGPFLAVADVNGDGMEDFFAGGGAGQAACLFFQKPNGTFYRSVQPGLEGDAKHEDMQALFFDAEGDGDPDLYVVSGSNEFSDPALYLDRLYVNDGQGIFTRNTKALPELALSGQALAGLDFDGDGDTDLVVGGRILPGQYPLAPGCLLLENRAGTFVDVSAEKAPGLKSAGMVTALSCPDWEGDGDPDLVLAGDWMSPELLLNENGTFRRDPWMEVPENQSGWWFSLAAGDLDGDGDTDLVAGNLGLNNRYHPQSGDPLYLYYADFDNNGKGDIILAKKEDGFEYPLRNKEYLSMQLPYLEQKYPDFAGFAAAELSEIFPGDLLSQALKLEARTFESCVLINEGGGKASVRPLPPMAQVSPLMGIEIMDMNGDGHPDIIAAGNLTGTDPSTIRYDAGSGICLLGDGKGEFRPLSPSESGIYLPGDVRDLQRISLAGGQQGILVSQSDGPLRLLKLD